LPLAIHAKLLSLNRVWDPTLTRIGAINQQFDQGAFMTVSIAQIRNIGIAVFMGLTVAGCGYNTIPTLEEQAKAKWGDVQNNYQRRADLIPNLVATVQGYAKQEREVLTAVIEARAKATQIKVDASQLTDPEKVKQFQDAQNQLSGALGRLIAVSENYPDLKSNQNFLALQSQLEGTENRIAVARRDYIEAVRLYNTELRTFPGILWANTFFRGNKPMAEFAASENADKPPTVKF
jgi:LemA protein